MAESESVSTSILTSEQFLAGLETPGLALDIDDTLSNTSLHWLKILSDKFGSPDPDLSMEQILAKYRGTFTEDIPHFQTDECLAFIEHFKSDPELQAVGLPLIDGAVQGVADLQNITNVVGYITVRPVSAVERTREWLISSGFPDLPILARPADVAHEDGSEWKGETLRRCYPTVTGIVDDSPSVLRACGRGYGGRVFLFGSSRPDLLPCGVSCPEWSDVLSAVRRSKEDGSLLCAGRG